VSLFKELYNKLVPIKKLLPNYLGNFCKIKTTNTLTSTSLVINYLGQECPSVAAFPPLYTLPRRETYAPEPRVSSKRT